MTQILKNLTIVFLLVIQSVIAFATTNTASRSHTVSGIVVDARSGQPIEFATIAVYTEPDHTLAGGGITNVAGEFVLKNIAVGNYKIEIAFMGYSPTNQSFIMNNSDINLGKIELNVDVKQLETVDVVADKAAVDYKIDKKVVNVSQQLNAQSGTAIDVLENVPSIKVDIDGNVTMRGSSSFTVLIDGRPTPLDATDALRTIPASSIDNIEIITNPSAKYEPDGATGVLNIVTKKNSLNGLSGVFNVNIGYPMRLGGNFTLDYRTGKWHMTLGADGRAEDFKSETENERRVGIDTITFTTGDGTNHRKGSGYGVNGAVDYQFTPKINLGMNFRLGFHDFGGNSDMDYLLHYNYNADTLRYSSYSKNSHGGHFRSFGIFYTQQFGDDKEHQLEIQANMNGRDNDDESYTYQYYENGDIESGKKTEQDEPGAGYRFNLDYVKPFSIFGKLSLGAQGRFHPSTDDYSVHYYDTVTKAFVHQDLYSYKTDYVRQIYSVYAMYAGEFGDFGYQGGLRGEYTYQDLELSENKGDYHFDDFAIFPTLHLSYQLPADQQIMLSYTRRINRTRPWQLHPYVTWQDAYNVRRGNPELEPEHVNSIDFGYQKKFNQNFVALDAYYRITENTIERVQSAYEGYSNVILHTSANVGTDYAVGAELTLNYEPISWYQLNLSGDMYDYRKKGSYNAEDFSQHSFNWNARMNNIFKIGNYTRVQIDLNYRSKTVTSQGYEKAFFATNAAVKYEMFDRKLSATLQARNILGTVKWRGVSEGNGFYTSNSFRPQWPQFALMLSYRINNYKAKTGGGDEDDSINTEGDFGGN